MHFILAEISLCESVPQTLALPPDVLMEVFHTEQFACSCKVTLNPGAVFSFTCDLPSSNCLTVIINEGVFAPGLDDSVAICSEDQSTFTFKTMATCEQRNPQIWLSCE
jgi:hypothetical protein